jgi:signal transduction histidine kinase
MEPDARTLMLMFVILAAFSTLLLAALWWMHQQIKGLAIWAIGMGISVIGSILLFGRGIVPMFVSVFGGNTLLLVGVALIAVGNNIFAERSPPTRFLVFLVIGFSVPFFLLYDQPEAFGVRVGVSATALMVFSFLAGLPLLKIPTKTNPREAFVIYLVAGAFLFNAAINLFRVGAVVFGEPTPGLSMWEGNVTAWYYLWNCLFACCIASGFPVLVTERLSNQLRLRVSELDFARHVAESALTEQRNFLTMISHEFRTPLAIIDASSEVISCNLEPNDNNTESIEEISRIRRATRRLANLVEGCLADEWLASTSHISQKHRLDIREILENLAIEYDVTIEWRFERTPLVNSDSYLLPVAISSVIDNACKYAKSSKNVRIIVEMRENPNPVMLINVLDDGPGIDRADADRIFEKYYRAPKTLQKQGTGLGLYLARKIVELHHGTVKIGNAFDLENLPECLKNGTVFQIELPASFNEQPADT